MIDCKINKELETGSKITFFLGNSVVDGTIIEKVPIGKGDISFTIQTKNGVCRVKHRNLDLY